MLRSRQRGFTMIELVVVIVILGILAAFALPKFMGLENQARVAAVNGMTGSIRSAANMAHGVWLANGNTTPIVVDGTNINIVFGYPDAAGILSLIQDTSGFTTAVRAPFGVKVVFGAATAATCNVVYNQATTINTPFTLTVQTPATLQTSC